MKPDNVYVPASNIDQSLPLILVEVRCTVDLDFFCHVNEYCLQMIKEYRIPPIVVNICINNTTQDVLDIELDKILIYLMRIPCIGWVKSFNLLNAGSINPYLKDQPINPLVAIAHFFVEQKMSLRSMELKNDPTIQFLFTLAQDIFQNDIQEHGTAFSTLKQVCNQTSYQFSKAKERLMEDIEDPNRRKRIIICLDDGIAYANEICEEYDIILEPIDSVGSSSPSAPVDLNYAPQNDNKD